MFERFTKQARAAVIAAQQEARALGHAHIGTEHLLLGVLAGAPDGVGARVLSSLGVTMPAARAQVKALLEPDAGALEAIGIDLGAVRSKVEQAFGPGALERRWRRSGRWRRWGGHIPFTPGAKKALELSLREALNLRHDAIGTEHIVLGLVRERDAGAVRALRGLGVEADVGDLRRRIVEDRRRHAA